MKLWPPAGMQRTLQQREVWVNIPRLSEGRLTCLIMPSVPRRSDMSPGVHDTDYHGHTEGKAAGLSDDRSLGHPVALWHPGSMKEREGERRRIN